MHQRGLLCRLVILAGAVGIALLGGWANTKASGESAIRPPASVPGHAERVSGFLSMLAPQALVVVGLTAPEVEQKAAEQLAKALREAGGPEHNLRHAGHVNRDLELAATHHLLVVGTGADNRILARVPSHWAMNRDHFYRTHKPFAPWMPTHGYYVAGYGVFPSNEAVGYVECDRNPYWAYATNLLMMRRHGPKPKLAYRQIVRLTGNSPAGVVLAVHAFLNEHLLNGVATANDALPGAMTLWTMDTAHLALPGMAPGWIPRETMRAGRRSLIFAGWQLADSMMYAGLREVSGQAAQKIWRAKYLTERGWNYSHHVVINPEFPMSRSPLFDASLARRAGGNEFFVAQFASTTQARLAQQAAEQSLNDRGRYSQAPWHAVVVDGVQWQRSRFDFNTTVFGKYLVMESFGKNHVSLALAAISKAMVKR